MKVTIDINEDELKKCQEDPYYWYTTYFNPGVDMTREEFQERKKAIEAERNMFNLYDRRREYPLTPERSPLSKSIDLIDEINISHFKNKPKK